MNVLERWKKQTTGERPFPFTGLKTAWNALLGQAEIEAFRWHDMRHDFASRLASKGVPLNTIRELLGHQSLAMTLRYAHLQPDQKAAAVAKLVELSSLTQGAAANAPAARSSSSPKARLRALHAR
jgi:integrase